jgi:hypothetical protein
MLSVYEEGHNGLLVTSPFDGNDEVADDIEFAYRQTPSVYG